MYGAGWANNDWGAKSLLPAINPYCGLGSLTGWNFGYFNQPDENGYERAAGGPFLCPLSSIALVGVSTGVMNECRKHVVEEVVGEAALFRVNATENGKKGESPFYTDVKDRTHLSYRAYWKQMLSFVVRAELDWEKEERPPYRFTRGQRMALVRLIQKAEDSEGVEVKEEMGREEREQMDELDRTCLRFCIELLDHRHWARRDVGCGHPLQTIYSAIIKIARALVVEEGYQAWTRKIAACKLVGMEEEEATAESPYQLIRQMVDRFMGLEGGTRDPSPMDWTISKRTYGMAIRAIKYRWAVVVVEATHTEARFETAVCPVNRPHQVATTKDHEIRVGFSSITGVDVVQLAFHRRTAMTGTKHIEHCTSLVATGSWELRYTYYLWLVLPFGEKVQISVDPDFRGSPFIWRRPVLEEKREKEHAKQPVRSEDNEDDLEEAEQPVKSEEIETIGNDVGFKIREATTRPNIQYQIRTYKRTGGDEADDSAIRAVVGLVEQLKFKYPAPAKIIVNSQEIKEAEKLSEA
ncbi:hypothetical protein V490_07721 [Pseudogymnoascus sp. VKM F-3557]|nr:hypothetical protein V490_07721 [Pseudogymnoascus sp. VKM F-3557]